MTLLEKAYKVNEFGETVKEIAINEVFETWEEAKARADEFEGYLILANHNTEIHGECATTRDDKLVSIRNLKSEDCVRLQKNEVIKVIKKRLPKKLGIKIETIEYRKILPYSVYKKSEQFNFLVNGKYRCLVGTDSTDLTPSRMFVFFFESCEFHSRNPRIKDEDARDEDKYALFTNFGEFHYKA